MTKTGVAIIGSGNIGTDLLIKILRTSKALDVVAFVGVDPQSDGLARARNLGVLALDTGLDGLMRRSEFEQVSIIFDATSATVHRLHNECLKGHGKRLIDLTPAAI